MTDTYKNPKTKPYKYSKNTGFHNIIDSRNKDYIENNIPDAIKNDRYKNNRINKNTAKNYSLSFFNKINKLLSRKYIDQKWINCWEGYTTKHTPQKNECYKSTLIIPMTLINNDLSIEFKKHFFKDEETKEKLALGFLCFDHTEIDYFKIIDTHIIYIIADLLSITG